MKYYFNKKDSLVYALEEDGSQDSILTEDFKQLTSQELAKLQEPPAKTLEDLEKEIVNAVTNRLQVFAMTRNYASIDSIGKYKDITSSQIKLLPVDQQDIVTRFKNECAYLAMANASTWAQLELMLKEVQSGVRPIPNSYEDIEKDLPVLSWGTL